MSQTMWLSSIEFLWGAGRAVALLSAFLILAWAFAQWRRASIRDAQRVFEQLDLVRSDLLIMKEAMNHSVRRSEPPMTESRAPMPPPASGAARGYEIAARMARNGASKEELMRNCGVTAHEAELLVKLHRRGAGAGAEMVGLQTRTPPQRPQAPAEAPRRRPQTSRLVAVG